MSDEESPASPQFEEGGQDLPEIDAEEMLAASNRAIAAARRAAARLFEARSTPQSDSGERADDGQREQ